VKLKEITSEGNVRSWLQEWISECQGRLKLEWIEPMMYGSTVGAPDCKISSGMNSVGLELKYLLTTKKGIKWEVRPAQRRYHHMHAKNGGRSALMAYIAATSVLVLVRGDNIPLRDYAKDPQSGCHDGKVKMWDLSYFSLDADRQTIFNLERALFGELFWEKYRAQN
jgi:hypothetical protein